jgi:hypothetical protein
MPDSTASSRSSETTARTGWFSTNLDIVIVILLGLVSLGAAYASFEASLYGGATQASYSKGNDARTQSESLYLEANQQYTQDAQTIAQLAQLKIAADAGDEIASQQYDELYFIAVSEDLDGAIQRADAQSDDELYFSPLDDEDYQAALFGAYADKGAEGDELITNGDRFNGYGDRLTLNSVLMAITLFLLGVAAVLRKSQLRWILIAVGMTIFTVAAVLTAVVPFVWL